MNHLSLLTAIMLHCGIPQELHNDVCMILADAKVGLRNTEVLFQVTKLLANISQVLLGANKCKRNHPVMGKTSLLVPLGFI